MKIEKLNDNQIRCTLSRKDLEERHIKLSELAYGSEKARDLFQDMIRQANEEFGFEVNDIPIMVEAIPANQETLVLVITKVEYPDELDTRFSKFSDSEEDEESSDSRKDSLENLLSKQGASDILNLFRQMKDEKDETEEKKEDTPADRKEEPEKKISRKTNLVRLFGFDTLDCVESFARVLKNYYHGKNDLYREAETGSSYFLFLHKGGHTPEEFNKVCNLASDYGYAVELEDYNASMAFFEEHGKLICKGNALEMLASL